MAANKSSPNVKWKLILLALLVLVVYMYLARPVEEAHDVANLGDIFYVATGQDGLRVVNASEPANPVEINYLSTPGRTEALYVDTERMLLFSADGRSGLGIYSLEDPNKPVEVSRVDLPGAPVDVVVRGRFAYVAARNGGVRVVDTKDPKTPKPVGQFQTRGRAVSVSFFGEYVLVGDTGKKLYVLDVANEKSPKELGEAFNAGGIVWESMIAKGHVLLAADERGLVSVDINISNIKATENTPATSNIEFKELGVYNTPGRAQGLALISDTYALVADGKLGLRIVDLTHTDQLREIGSLITYENVAKVRTYNDNVYLADGFNGMRIVKAEVLLEPETLGSSSSQANIEDVVVEGNLAYVASGASGIQVMDIRDPHFPLQVAAYDTPGSASSIVIAGDLAYITDQGSGLQVLDVSNSPAEIKPVTVFGQAQEANGVAVNQNMVYLADGAAGLRVLDFTNFTDPVQLGIYDSPGYAAGAAVSGDFVYLADGVSGLRILNAINPTAPVEIGVYDTPGDARYVTLMAKETPQPGPDGLRVRLYALVADGSRGLRVLDVTDPLRPREVGIFEAPGFVQDIFVDGETVYLAARDVGIYILNLSNPAAPRLIGFYDTPGKAYHLHVAGGLAYVADFEHGLRVINVTQPAKPVEVGFFDAPARVRALAMSGNYAYSLDGEQGVWTMDLSDPRLPKPAGFYPLPGLSSQIVRYDPYWLIANGAAGLQVLKQANERELARVATYNTPGNALAVTVQEAIAYVSDGDAGVQILDLSNPAGIRQLSSINTSGMPALDVAIQGGHAYIAVGQAGVQIVKVSDPRAPQTVQTLSAVTDVRAVEVKDSYLYLAAGANGFHIIEISHPLAPELRGALDTPGTATDLILSYPYAFVADGTGGVAIIDVSNPEKPVLAGGRQDLGVVLGILAAPKAPEKEKPGTFGIYLANGDQGLRVLEATKSSEPDTVGLYETPGTATPEQLLRWARSLLTGQQVEVPAKAGRTVLQILFDLVVLGLCGLVVWMALISQFVLPVSRAPDRLMAFYRLVTYLLGQHGPAVHVKDGQVIQHAGEQQRRGPGVILVDACSAVVLESYPASVSFINYLLANLVMILSLPFRPRGDKSSRPSARRAAIRASGPGLVFTGSAGPFSVPQYGERLRGQVDLRPQVRGRKDIQALTQDGIEVQCNVSCVFTLGQPPAVLLVTYDGERKAENIRVIQLDTRIETQPAPGVAGRAQYRQAQYIKALVDELDQPDKEEIHRWVQTQVGSASPVLNLPGPPGQSPAAPYTFDPERVFAAVYADAPVAQDSSRVDWQDLPAFAAAEVFRNMLARETYDSLYKPLEPEALDMPILKARFARAVRNMGVLAYQFVERLDNKPLLENKPHENEQEKKEPEWRPSELRLYPVQNLRNPKILRARGIKVIGAGFSELKPALPEIRETLLENWRATWKQGQTLVQSEYEMRAMRVLNQGRVQAQQDMAASLSNILRASPLSEEALALRIFQALEKAAAEPTTRQLLPAETLNMLRSLREWF